MNEKQTGQVTSFMVFKQSAKQCTLANSVHKENNDMLNQAAIHSNGSRALSDQFLFVPICLILFRIVFTNMTARSRLLTLHAVHKSIEIHGGSGADLVWESSGYRMTSQRCAAAPANCFAKMYQHTLVLHAIMIQYTRLVDPARV